MFFFLQAKAGIRDRVRSRGLGDVYKRQEDVLAGIHVRYATVIRLRLCEEKPRAVCAAALGVSVETFDVLLLRAVRAFRKAYGEPDAG